MVGGKYTVSVVDTKLRGHNSNPLLMHNSTKSGIIKRKEI